MCPNNFIYNNTTSISTFFNACAYIYLSLERQTKTVKLFSSLGAHNFDYGNDLDLVL